jgi:hypothetical protein
MACLGRLLPRTRLYTARHLGRLAPLLLEWLLAPDARSRAAALGCWDGLLRCCWPRMGAHAAVLWRHLVAAARGADIMGSGWGLAGVEGEKEEEEPEAGRGMPAAFLDVGRLLLAIFGQDALVGVGGGGSEGAGGGQEGRAQPGQGPRVEPPGACEAALLSLLE